MSRPPKKSLDEIDRRIIRLLRDDGRLRSVAIARQIGVSEKTVRDRVERLVQLHGLRFHAELTGEGSGPQMMFLITARPGARFALAEELANHPHVRSTLVTDGNADVVLRAAFGDDAAVVAFQNAILDRNPAIERYATCKIVADSNRGEIGTPEQVVISAGRVAEMLSEAASLPTMKEFLEWVGPASTSLMSAQSALTCLLEPDGTLHVQRLSWHNMPTEYSDAIYTPTPSPRRFGVIYRAATTLEPVFLPDAAASPLFAGLGDLIVRGEFRAVLALPMREDSLPLGVLTVYFGSTVALDSADIRVAQEFADGLASIVHRLRTT